MSATEVEVGGDVTLDLSQRRQQFVPQQSTLWSRRQQAVCVRRAFKVYGTKKQPHVILDGLNMTVPKGCIYGLLGASGCGKTTLLSCIVGRRRLNSGEIWVLGGKPGSKGSGVPGPRIGYMPQELALYGEFSIREALIYFGWIANMKTEQVEEKLDFVMKFLQLPSASRLVKNLSGGQQRRTSFAAAMIHSPELLILDEPTVGVDPILRQNIWDYLVDITKNGKVTVIITTHYIEETRQAHMIGLMRGGKFLAEESPEDLLAMHMCDSLEGVFLKLSKLQNQGKRRRSSYMQEVMGPPVPEEEPTAFDTSSEISGEYGDNISMSNKDITTNDNDNQPLDLPPEEGEKWGCMDYLNVFSTHRMKALLWKNFLWMWRNVGIMAFVIGLPVLQIILFSLSIGRDPRGLHLAVVNDELEDPSYCPTLSGCHLDLLSCQYLDFLKKKTIVVDLFSEEEQALEAVRRGNAWGAMRFLANYSQSLVERLEAGRYATEETINNSDVRVWLDMSNQQIGLLLNRNLILSFRDFAFAVVTACNYSANLVASPIRFNDPVYGDQIPNFTDFAAPGVILTIIFFLAVALTSGAMLIERNEGMLERCLVSGITAIEILFSHVATQFLVMAGQTVLVLVFSFVVFGIQCNGPMVWVVIITMLSGFTGMCFGFVVSCVCDNERSATYLALGSFIPIVMLCGIIWPVEAMHPYLSWLSFILPLTQSTESLRAVLARGWGIAHPTVYYGFISSMIWIVIFLSISIFVLKFKKG